MPLLLPTLSTTEEQPQRILGGRVCPRAPQLRIWLPGLFHVHILTINSLSDQYCREKETSPSPVHAGRLSPTSRGPPSPSQHAEGDSGSRPPPGEKWNPPRLQEVRAKAGSQWPCPSSRPEPHLFPAWSAQSTACDCGTWLVSGQGPPPPWYHSGLRDFDPGRGIRREGRFSRAAPRPGSRAPAGGRPPTGGPGPCPPPPLLMPEEPRGPQPVAAGWTCSCAT